MWYLRGMKLGNGPIGEELLQIRTDLGLSRSDVAERGGVNKRTLERIENGKFSEITWGNLRKILHGLGVEVHITIKESSDG